MDVVVIGGGWAGCAAAFMAAKQGARTVLVERTDMLLGTGLVGGIMRNNGRFTATEELLAMGGGEIFSLVDQNLLHRNIDFPGHAHASLYNVASMEPSIRNFLKAAGVEIKLCHRITDVERQGKSISAVSGTTFKEPFRLEAQAFVDTTGTAGGPAACNKYGSGCAMCILRCHTFGARVSVAGKAGVVEMVGKKPGQTGAMSGSCKLHKESLSPEIRNQLDREGLALIPIPEGLQSRGKLTMKACQQYALDAFEKNIVLLDTGHAKLMTPFYPLDLLRQIPGFEQARYEDPYAGGVGNSIRYMAMAPRDDALGVTGLDNLFCAGEKAGLLVGHTEAICTGTLAGYNAARLGTQIPLVLPRETCIGDAVSHVREEMMDRGRLDLKFTFSGSVLFQRMEEQGRYTTNIPAIRERVKGAGLENIFQPG
ncbi:MAG: FAD-dependent oxidoreductase [Desulfovibrionales bacterium]|nr:FAD-dependent oxidoreductase [Desulfovibrionales bacterium]